MLFYNYDLYTNLLTDENFDHSLNLKQTKTRKSKMSQKKYLFIFFCFDTK